jgi:tryptophan synthase beta chain
MTRAPFPYDPGAPAGYPPLLPTPSLGHNFVPAPIHAGGLRYHGMAPTVSQLVNEGLLSPKSVGQMDAYKAGILWARTEGVIPAPETTSAIAQVVIEAEQAKQEGKEKTIVFNFSGHGLLDLGAYEKFFAGELADFTLEDEEIEKSTEILKSYPTPQDMKST